MTSFLSACGVTDSLRLIVKSQAVDGAELRLLRQPFAVIGRTPRADIVLDHDQVSRRHVYLQVVGGRAFWIDLESRTGTRAEGELQKFGWLQGALTLCVGPYVFQRYADEGHSNGDSDAGKPPHDTPLVALAYSRAPLPQVTLEFLNGPSQSTSWPMHRVMSLIGSAGGCKFRLTDPSVSRFHASLLRTAAGLWVVDLLGQSNVTVNEMAVRYGRLSDGDVLGIGRYRIRVRCRCEGEGSGHGSATISLAVPQRSTGGSNGLGFPDWAAAVPASAPEPGGLQGVQFPLPVQTASAFPRWEVMPATTTLPADASQSEVIKSVLVPLVNQVGMMHQQMIEQFHQAMTLMVQMFGTMHHNQMEAIRTELEQLRELTKEFHALKHKLADRTETESRAVARESAVTRAETSEQAKVADSCSAAGSGDAREEPDSDRDAIVWLHQRIMILQRERESRWQKILRLLPGVS
jgi:pSer/pThr/pTyr-binding forkhead associated (FHA) protein